MPTGYTSKLHNGEQAFEAFVWGCAHAFGALILMRDEPSDSEVTEDRLTTDYYERRVAECEVELAEWAATTEEARRALHASWIASEQKSRGDHEATRVARKARYVAMLDKVRAWEPPTPEHVELRKFMLEQLETSIDFDCSVFPHSPLPGFVAWCDQRGEQLRKSVQYATEERAKERTRNESRIAWVRALKASVPMPAREAKP